MDTKSLGLMAFAPVQITTRIASLFSIIALAISFVVAGVSFSYAPVLAQNNALPLAAATLDKIAYAPELSKLMANNPGGRYRVIVQYTPSNLSDVQSLSDKQKDEVQISRNHAVQNGIINAVLGSADAVISGPLSDTYNIKRMNYSPMLVMHLSAEEIDQMAARPEVTRIEPDIAAPPSLLQSTVQVDIPNVWEIGGTGSGRTVAIIDTGVKKSHEFITPGRVVSEACYSTKDAAQGSTFLCPGEVPASTAAGSGEDCNTSFAEGCSHGTHVAGIAAGFNTDFQTGEPALGMAYEADIIAINVFSLFTNAGAIMPCSGASPCLLSYASDQVLGLERVYALRNTYDIDAINMSLGEGSSMSVCNGDSRATIIGMLRAAEIATVIPAGNDGISNAVNFPACIAAAITVASSLDNGDFRDIDSNWGNLVDMVAPGGFNIQSSVYGANVGSTSTYQNYRGTSMAAAHVTGAFAALRRLFPAATVSDIEAALESTGVPILSSFSSGVPKPRINMGAACVALGGNCDITPPDNDDFADAIILYFSVVTSGHTISRAGLNSGATGEAGEPFHFSTGASPLNSVWWKFTLTGSSGFLQFNTNGSSFDTILAVYTGSAVNALTPLTSDDDSGTGTASLVTFNAISGTTYYVAVDGKGSATGTIALNHIFSETAIVASILPTARATQTPGTVTAFASILNFGTTNAMGCSIALPASIPGATFLYQTTDVANVPTGTPDTLVDIPAGSIQGFYFAIDAIIAFSQNIPLVFDCQNTAPVTVIWGVNTFSMTASNSPIADMVAIAATIDNTGYIIIPTTTGQQLATAAVVNIGTTGTIVASVTEQAIGGPDPNMPATLLICRTDAAGVCSGGFAAEQTFTATNGVPEYFTILAIGNGTVANDPAVNRAHLYFRDGADVVGATSVAVRTAP